MSGLLANLKARLEHPLTRGCDLDDPATTALRRRVIQQKPFLKRIYVEWYRALASHVPTGNAPVLELGSGAGFLAEFIAPPLIASDIFTCPNVDVVLDAHQIPMHDGSLRAIVMTNVFHHLADAERFLAEAQRCLRPGGVLIMIEPWINTWSRWVYRTLHHEPIDIDTPAWRFPPGGPLSAANGALPWIVFQRDAARLGAVAPHLKLELVRPLMPLSYIFSGGISMRNLLPGWSYRPIRFTEHKLLGPLSRRTGMFALIVVRRADGE